MTEELPEETPAAAPLDGHSDDVDGAASSETTSGSATGTGVGTDASDESIDASAGAGAIGSVVATDGASDADGDDIAEETAIGGTTSGPRSRRLVIIAAIVAVLVVAGVVIGLVTRGGSSKKADPNAPAETKSSSLDDVKVTGAFGEKPTVTFKPAYVGTEETFKVISEGDGPEVTEGQRVTLDYVAISGADGSELDSTFGQTPQAVTASHTSLTAALADGLVGQHVGSRVLVAGDQTQAQPAAWVLFVFDIKSAETLPTSASGTPQTPKAGFPTVTVDNGVPKIATPTGNPPTTLETEVLIKGNGPAITSGQTVTMHYTGIIWATGKEFDSSWAGDPVDFPVGDGQVIAGFDEGLVGQTVGSRVLLVIPPDKGYGSGGNSQAGIGGTDTLVFVVDLLAAS
jgi:peptidylprolyl isomerase